MSTSENGVLFIKVVKALDLPLENAAKSFHCVLTVNKKKLKTSPSKAGGMNSPLWDEEMEIPFPGNTVIPHLRLEVHSERGMVGEATVHLDDMYDDVDHVVEGYHELFSKKRGSSGFLYVSIIYRRMTEEVFSHVTSGFCYRDESARSPGFLEVTVEKVTDIASTSSYPTAVSVHYLESVWGTDPSKTHSWGKTFRSVVWRPVRQVVFTLWRQADGKTFVGSHKLQVHSDMASGPAVLLLYMEGSRRLKVVGKVHVAVRYTPPQGIIELPPLLPEHTIQAPCQAPVLSDKDKKKKKIAHKKRKANHRADDVVVCYPNVQTLCAKFSYGLIVDEPLQNEPVEVYILCELGLPWSFMGMCQTDSNGWVTFVLGKNARSPGSYPVRMVAQKDRSECSFMLYVVYPGTNAVVFDIDGTLTTSDAELFKKLIKDMTRELYDPQMYEDAQTIVQTFSSKGYLPVYVSGRPNIIRNRTIPWLVDKGLPPGPYIVTSANTEILPTQAGVGTFKTRVLKHLIEEVKLTFYAGFGNALTDIFAYENAAIPKERTYIIGKHGGKKNTVNLNSYRDILHLLPSVPEAQVPAPLPRTWFFSFLKEA